MQILTPNVDKSVIASVLFIFRALVNTSVTCKDKGLENIYNYGDENGAGRTVVGCGLFLWLLQHN